MNERFKNFNFLNNIVGWAVFLIALVVYTLTLEPTVSYWDCGEFLLSAYKLEVVHPPGAPLFAMVAKLFMLLAPDVTKVAVMGNFFSGLTSAFTVLFGFWIITRMGVRYLEKIGKAVEGTNMYSVLAAGVIGGVSTIFLDSFWFSATEGEVYAFAAFFSVMFLWLMLKWERVADKPGADRLLVLLGLMIGLSVGSHLLPLLAIPALAYIYYFKKYKTTVKGTILTFFAGGAVLATILFLILDRMVLWGAHFDKFFVNSLSLPYWSGFLTFWVIIVLALGFMAFYAVRKGMPLLHTASLFFLMVILGASNYTMVITRASANPPINMNAITEPYKFHNYLKREQYGSRPLLYGPTFTAEPITYKETRPYYSKDYVTGKYVITGYKRKPVLDPDEYGGRIPARQKRELKKKNKKVFFPRLGSLEGRHKGAYRQWLNLGPNESPSYADNLNYFFNYQMKYMYWRYFMWNFSGRQDDIEGSIQRGLKNGNWITGIPAIDRMDALAGSEYDKYESRVNKARNKFYLLPFILGLLGLIFHFKYEKRGAIVIAVFFVFMGIMNLVNSNQPPFEPRERDYAVAISFCAFAMWIGLGLLYIFHWLKKYINSKQALAASFAVCLIVPILLGAQGWDDHDRSNRYLARASAINYLQSCDSNAILFTQGDNDTYPLWYLQEIEGIRTDVRIINLSLLAVDWYIEQITHKMNDSDPVILHFKPQDYQGETMQFITVGKLNSNRNGSTEYGPFIQRFGRDMLKAVEFISSNSPTSIDASTGYKFLPIKTLELPVDPQKAIAVGMVEPNEVGKLADKMVLKFGDRKTQMGRDQIIMLDIIASNIWKRPIYFASSTSERLNLDKYVQYQGLADRLIPLKKKEYDYETIHENITQKWNFANMSEYESVYLDATAMRNARGIFRQQLIQFIQQFAITGQTKPEIRKMGNDLVNILEEKVPSRIVPFTMPEEFGPYINALELLGRSDVIKKHADHYANLMDESIEEYASSENMSILRNQLGKQSGVLQAAQSLKRNQRPQEIDLLLRYQQMYNSLISSIRNSGDTEMANSLQGRWDSILKANSL